VTLNRRDGRDPDWQRNIWQLFTQIEQDIPMPQPEPPTPFEEYANYYQGDDFRPDSWAIAVDETAGYVGMCVVNVMRKRPYGLFAGITGVIRSHRRRKIATALKMCSIRYAQENGFQTIYTNNEENNPMYQLNLDLGFKPLPAWAYYEKELGISNYSITQTKIFPMRMIDLIEKKRDGKTLSTAEIEWFIRAYTADEVVDYQVAALLMAIYIRGMDRRETVDLTLAMAHSGDELDLHDVAPFVIDKHSSGGVGDKTTLAVQPLVAACGVPVGKMSGRGLGSSGGTLDKMEVDARLVA
jgi:GNAT superfamily N-acetyltransferase